MACTGLNLYMTIGGGVVGSLIDPLTAEGILHVCIWPNFLHVMYRVKFVHDDRGGVVGSLIDPLPAEGMLYVCIWPNFLHGMYRVKFVHDDRGGSSGILN